MLLILGRVRGAPAILTAVLATISLAAPATARAVAGWVPGFDEVAPSGNVREPVAVITPGLRTVALWVDYPGISAAVRPRGGTFGEAFELDSGNANYVAGSLGAVALPDGEVVAAWSGPSTLQEMRVKSLFPDGTIATALPTEPGGAFPAIAANSAGMVALAYYSFNEVRLAIRPAGADAFESSVLLTTLVGNEQPAGTSSNEGVVGALDVTVREDGQVAVAIGTEVINPPGGTARMLIARRVGGTTTVETIDSRTLNLTPPSPGQTESAAFHHAIELLPDGRQLLVYRLQSRAFNGNTTRELRGGPRDGSPAGVPPLLEQTFGPAFGPTEHDLTVDDADRPWLWWRHGIASGQEELRVRQATTAGAFSAPYQVLASPVFQAVDMKAFGDGRTGVLFTESGKVKASTSEGGAPFAAPTEVATPAALPSPTILLSVGLAGAGEGSAVAVWPDGATLNTSSVHATQFDATPPPLADLQAPASLTAGVAGTFAATAQDDWSVPSVSWLFGDGATVSGASVQHSFPAAGSFTATATATDAVGNTATGARTVTVTAPPPSADKHAPVLSGVRLVPRTLRRGQRTTTLHFRLDEAATVVAQLERARPGFRSGRRCVARRPRREAPRRCTRFVRYRGALRRAAAPGANRLKIRRPRAKGRYRVRVHAVDVAGNRSAAQKRALRVR